MRSASSYNGLVLVDKPAGMTSHDVVDAARRWFRTKRVGHTGTLDPDATGLLVLCLGQATRLAEYLSADSKHYVAEFVFGVETDTQDASGQVVAERDASSLTEAALRLLLPRFQGTIEQIPPMVSARHHQGQRLYTLARAGITVAREARKVHIFAMELNQFVPGPHPIATLEVTCSTGTYLRALAADLGAAAGVGGMMRFLRRTWIGTVMGTGDVGEAGTGKVGLGEAGPLFSLEDAYTLDTLNRHAEAGTLPQVVLSLSVALRAWPQVRLKAEQQAQLRNGQAISLVSLADGNLFLQPSVREATPVAVLDTEGEVCAIARIADGRLHPVKVLT